MADRNRIVYKSNSIGWNVLVILLFLLQLQEINSYIQPTIQTSSASIAAFGGNQENVLLRETLVIPESDIERQVKELQETALKEYGITGLTLKQICAPWDSKGCQCSGSSMEVTLLCRGVGLEEIPVDLPTELIKL